jgi:hypothetical protein
MTKRISFLCVMAIFVCCFMSILLQSCANMSTPTGGYKDVRKPKIRFSDPKNQSLFVKHNRITILFDEAVKLKNIKSNLAIIPNTDNDYEYSQKKNRLTLQFKKAFLPNTTYVLIFDEVIEDLNESNKASNMRLAFSTGGSIDSLKLRGVVRDIFTNKPEKEAIVMLYNALDTFKVEKHKPLYYAKTDTAGRYNIGNIKAGKYFAYAITEDKKKNMIYDDSKEKIGFSQDTLMIEANGLPFVDFGLINYDFKPLKITSKRPRKQYFEIKANKKLSAVDADFADTTLYKQIFYHVDNDVVRFYNHTNKESTDSLLTFLTIKDSVGNSLKDTFKIKFEALKPKEKKAAALKVEILPEANEKFMKGEVVSPVFKFSVPVITVQADSIFLQIGKDTIKVMPNDLVFDTTRMTMRFAKPFKITDNITLKTKSKTFISVEGDTLKEAQDRSYGIKKPENFAKLSGIIRTTHPHFILQLLNEKNIVEKESRDKKEFLFDYVTMGKKTLRLIIDTNGNGKWDSGDFSKKQPPEQMFFFSDERLEKIAPNWEYEDIIVEVKE